METPTQLLHRLTSVTTFDLDRVWEPPVDDPRVLQDLVTNDPERFPWFYKRYPADLPRLALPRDVLTTTASALEVLGGRAAPSRTPLDLAQISRLLHLSAGVVRAASLPARRFLFRAAGSAGGRFPLEVYVAAPAGGELPAGTYWYHPEEHALVNIGPPPEGAVPCIVVTGVPWRTGWRYRERGYRHIYWDAGTMLSQLLAAAHSAGVPANLYSAFPDGQIASLVGADGVHEFPVAVVALGEDLPAIAPAGPATTGEVDAAPVEFPLITAAQSAGECTGLGRPWPHGDIVEGVSAESASFSAESPTVEAVVLSRGSQRRMDPARGLPSAALDIAMAVALRGVTVPHWVVVHDVAGREPGLYRWPDLSAPIRSGTMRDEVYRVCMQQSLGAEAAFVVIAAADVSSLDDHQYRDAHLAAGLVEGRLHLAAYAMGASASGMTFVDGLIGDFLGEELNGLLITCVGVPEYASKAGGQPGAPVTVRMVTPRMDDR
jgi:nitroreductase